MPPFLRFLHEPTSSGKSSSSSPNRIAWTASPSLLRYSHRSGNSSSSSAGPLPSSSSFTTPNYRSTMAYSGAEKVSNDRMTVQGKEVRVLIGRLRFDMIGCLDRMVKFGGAECALPSLSTLLEDPTINDPDSFVICVQIHCPVGPTLAAQPAVYYVPKDLLDGLEASHDIPCAYRNHHISVFQSPLLPAPGTSPCLNPLKDVNVNRNVSSTIHVHRQLLPIHSGNTRGRYVQYN
ncbi:hypothetical protein F5880DRAFT_1632324 [Lentinula raphanica]|nr:hypothetical protein F5880DRAFT_1632324 [Lentinula raphanica]